jgi:hypothetical protein
MDNDKVMVFVRPKETPAFNLEPKDTRIAYGNIWIDFRDGQVVASNNEGHHIFDVPAFPGCD